MVGRNCPLIGLIHPIQSSGRQRLLKTKSHPNTQNVVDRVIEMNQVPSDKPSIREVIKAARIVTGLEIKIGIALLIFAAVFPTAACLWWGRPDTFGEFTTLFFLWIYMFAVIATFAIIILWGLGRLDLPGKFMGWLGAATIGEIVGLLAYVLHQIFGN